MDVKRLQDLQKHLKSVDKDKFRIMVIRTPKDRKLHINTGVTDIIGHAIALDSPENVDKFRNYNKEIRFIGWAEHFFGLEKFTNEWDFIFNIIWWYEKETRTIEHTIKRIQQLIDGYQPQDVIVEIKKIQELT